MRAELALGRVRDTEADFWAKMSKPAIGCWEWSLSLSPTGYGKATYKSKGWRAHRLAHYLMTGEKPEVVMHTCDNPGCCNPLHLVAGSHKANMKDMTLKNRQHRPQGTKHSQNKYSDDMILEIRDRHSKGETQAHLSREYGICTGYVSQIVRRIRWAHI